MGGCTVIWQTVVADPVALDQDPVYLNSPTRAYLADGSIVVLAGGGMVENGVLQGHGTRFALTLDTHTPFASVALDSVVAMEAFRTEYENQTQSALLAMASLPVLALASATLLAATFGSCPTIYAEIEGDTILQAEPFSYSISALFEARDVDRLTARPEVSEDGRSILRLELRNEAMETHYFNHMELLEVSHAPHDVVIPDPSGRALVLRDLRAPSAAVDGEGRNVLAEITAHDGHAFRSSRTRLARASETDFQDFVEFEVPWPSGRDEIALVLRYRNTLLNTVLFYDIMLGESGLRALDWIGSDLHRIGAAVELARWYQDRMGMRVEVERDGVFELVDHLPDAGPIAWTERAVTIPVPAPTRTVRTGTHEGDASARPGSDQVDPVEVLRVRLRFPVDSWFIDRIAVAEVVGIGEPRRVPVDRVVDARGLVDPEASTLLAAPDEDYLVTFPGQRMHLEFALPEPPSQGDRTLLLATQGFYVEWLRGPWLRADPEARPFRPEDGAILRAMRRWTEVMDDYERDFHASRIPVR